MNLLKLFLASSFIFLTGCQTFFHKYPSKNELQTVYVSSDYVNKTKYSSPRDKTLKDAQVVIGLSRNDASATGFMLSDLTLAFDIINITSKSKAVSDQLDFLKTQKFDKLVKSQLEKKLSASDSSIEVINKNNANFLLVPFVFISASPDDFHLDFTIGVNIKNEVRMYHYRSKHFETVKDINEEEFNQISEVAFDKILTLILNDMDNKIDYLAQDKSLEEKCIPLSGKTWAKIGFAVKVNYNYVKNEKNECIANLKDSFGVEFSGYPHVFIFE